MNKEDIEELKREIRLLKQANIELSGYNIQLNNRWSFLKSSLIAKVNETPDSQLIIRVLLNNVLSMMIHCEERFKGSDK